MRIHTFLPLLCILWRMKKKNALWLGNYLIPSIIDVYGRFFLYVHELQRVNWLKLKIIRQQYILSIFLIGQRRRLIPFLKSMECCTEKPSFRYLCFGNALLHVISLLVQHVAARDRCAYYYCFSCSILSQKGLQVWVPSQSMLLNLSMVWLQPRICSCLLHLQWFHQE